MSDIPIIQASDYRSALDFTNKADAGEVELPVWIKAGESSFLVTAYTLHLISIGVLMASSWPETENEPIT